MSLDKITKGDELTQSLDIVNDNIARLKELFPEVLTEGKIDFKVLQDILGKEIEEEEEYYRFTWAGKAQARREAHKPSTGTLRPAKDESVNWDTTENLYIEGDNLEVLKLLQKSYANKVKMIYIDPPYNTGKDFVYKDNYKDNLKNYQQISGQIDDEGNRLTTNSESDGRFHSNWLNLMYPRLKLARNLLKEDGVIFMSIDDNEVVNLKKICDEIFGESCVEQYIWDVREDGSMPKTAKNTVRKEHEYILVAFKNINNKRFTKYNSFKYRDLKGWTNSDNDPRGNWMSANISRGSGEGSGGSKSFTIINPEGIEFYRDWSVSEEEFKILLEDNRIYFADNGKGVPRKKIFQNESVDSIQSSLFENLQSSQSASKIIKDLIGDVEFDYPKPTALIERLIQISCNDNDLILDFFSGSSTTAHAVILRNLEDSGTRKFIMVQLPEPTDIKSNAFSKGFKNIADIAKERIRQASKKLANDNPEKAKELDLGFKVFKLDSSNIKGWDGNPDNLVDNLFDSQDNIKEGRTEEDVLFEILLKYGLDLTLPIEEKIIEGKKVFSVGFGALFVCLADGITNKVAEGIGAWKEALNPEVCRVIFKDSGFGDVEKTNSVQTLKRFGINEIKSI
ncbi:Type III restriction-modification system methylation subunit [Flavobacterium sp. 9R]|uniref:site-specific DNA-methyltransferase n=1 Tax=Flavobacterium sp. 9R TaxID=2653143 RepID=UPI0012F09D56|nr:site-specific DNA-methyltransferase [Flavobacterium sp. 9R]VXB47281.1 Type III restriction-modification system methylation subunit [Flavobacterium sp. 9R]